MYLVKIVLFSLIITFGTAQTGVDVKNLLTSLFTTNGYNKNVRPTANQTQPTQVIVDLFLVGINSLDEVSQKLTTTGYLYIEWTDEYLTWDPVVYNNIELIRVSQSDVWKPDITLQNGFTKLKELGDPFIIVSIDSSGSVQWLPMEIMQTKCQIDVTYFPFDRQTCDIKFVVWSNSIKEVNVSRGGKGIILDELDTNGVWRVISTSSSQDVEAFESRVSFSLTLARSASFYVINIIVPVILLGALNVFTFVLPADSGEKMGYSVTVYLSFAVFLTIVSSELPKTSGSILGYYLIFQLSMGTLVVIVTTIELRFHHRNGPIPERVIKVLKIVSCKRTKSSIKSSDTLDEKSTSNNTNTDVTWNDVISKVDFCFFWVTFIVTLIVTASMLGVLSSKY